MLSFLFAVAFGQVHLDLRPSYDPGEPIAISVKGAPKNAKYIWTLPKGVGVKAPGDVPTKQAPELYLWAPAGRHEGKVLVIWKTADDFDLEELQFAFEQRGPGPPPVPPVPPGPDPVRPAGFPGEVFDQAIKVSAPADCKRIAAKLRELAKAISDRRLTRVEDVPTWFVTYLKPLDLEAKWRDFGDWSVGQLQAKVQTLPAAVTVFTQAAEGLEAAGGK